MFSKFANLFQSSTKVNTNDSNMPFNHPKIDAQNSSQCPFMKKQNKGQMNSNPSQNNPQTYKNTDRDSDSQQQKPRGGCPFMGTSQKKKNPSLSLNSQGYDQPFVSKFKYYLSASKIDFSNIYNKNKYLPSGRSTFEKYPIYLQHTLFYSSQDYKKVRGMECCSRFMAYQQLREKGNKYYNKGKYYLALDYYERAMSLFRWLQYNQNQNQTTLSQSRSSSSLNNIDQSSDNGSNINIKLNDNEQNQEEKNPFDELRQKYKEFFITYNDDNTKYYDGEQLTQTPDIDMRKSLLVQVYLNMAAAYINLQHYYLAQQIINDGLTLSQNVSQLYFRKAQSIALNKSSSLQKLKQAKMLIQLAISMRPKQKIFNSSNANILRMLNLHDSQQSYQQCLENVQKAIDIREKQINKQYERVYNRAKQINEIEKRLISEGKIPKENLQQKSLHNTLQIKCLNKMINKYSKVIQFYTESKNQEQVNLAKKQFQEVLRVASQVAIIFQTDIHEKQNELGDIQSQKIKKRVNIIKTRFAEDLYNSGRYNFTMMQWAIKQIVKEQAQQQKAKKLNEKMKEQQQNMNINNLQAKVQDKKPNSLYMLLVIIPLVLIFLSSFMV